MAIWLRRKYQNTELEGSGCNQDVTKNPLVEPGNVQAHVLTIRF